MILEQNGDCSLSSSSLALQHLLCLGTGILQAGRRGAHTEPDKRMEERGEGGKRRDWGEKSHLKWRRS